MSDKTSQTQNKQTVELPDILYHYCSNEAFYNIIKTGTLRMSDISKSNDYAEQKLFVPNTLSMIMDLYKQNPFPFGIAGDTTELEMQSFLDFVQKEWNNIDYNGLFTSYVICFSSRGDHLSQWRGYSNDGNGVSIGFSTNCLATHCAQNNDFLKLQKIEYLTDNEIYEKRLDLAKRMLNKLKYCVYGKTIDESAKMMFELLRTTFIDSLAYKHCAFADENEWRIFITNRPFKKVDNLYIDNKNKNKTIYELTYEYFSKRLDFRFTENDIIPFCNLYLKELGPSIIKSIQLGPKNSARIEDVKIFVKKCAYDFYKQEVANNNIILGNSLRQMYEDIDYNRSAITYR